MQQSYKGEQNILSVLSFLAIMKIPTYSQQSGRMSVKRVPKEEKGKNREPEEKESEGKQEGKVRNKIIFSGIFVLCFRCSLH